MLNCCLNDYSSHAAWTTTPEAYQPIPDLHPQALLLPKYTYTTNANGLVLQTNSYSIITYIGRASGPQQPLSWQRVEAALRTTEGIGA